MAEFIKIYEDKPSEAAIKKVVDVLRKGGLVIYPTDTVYGLGCDITNSRALEKLAKIKGIKLEKRSFMNLEVTLYVKNQFDIKSKDVKLIINDLFEHIIDEGLSDKKLFNFYKTKK